MTAIGVGDCPPLDLMTTLLEWRIKALLVLNKPQEALEAAKSYYNVCALNQTERAVQLVGLCLNECHPNDAGAPGESIADQFRHEQAVESKIGVGAATEPSDASPAGLMLKSISVDAKLYDDGLTEFERRSRRFADRVAYANLLLVADKADQAEAIFRELLGSARNQDQINQAYDGVARSLRAEDGNLARANAYLRGKG
jgi:hypothetical protein